MIDILFDNTVDFSLRIVLILAVLAALIMALTLHEFAHAYVALKNGDRTAKINGRLSLNPMRHLDPIGFMMLMIMGFGYAKPVPVNPYNFRKKRLGVFTVSIAGVVTNIVLAFFSCGAYIAIIKFTRLNPANSFLPLFFNFFLTFNLILFFFNLLPLFPLDGFNLLTSLLKPNNRFLLFLRKYSQHILLLLIGLSIVVGFVGTPVYWWQYFDILGMYLRTFSGWVTDAFIWFWRFVFGI